MPRSLLPKEHGAYAQLLLPTSAALVCWPSLPGLALAAAALLAFLAHEPIFVATGRRGGGARERDGQRAIGRLVLLLAAAFCLGVFAAWTMEASARWALLVCASSAALSIGVAYLGRERSVPGELLVIASLASVALAVGVAGDATTPLATITWLSWLFGFGATVFAVRGVIHQHKRPQSLLRRCRGLLGWLTLAIAAVLAGYLLGADASWHAAIERLWFGTAPLILGAIALLLAPPHPRNLQRIGWVLAGASTLSAVILVAATY